MSLVCKKHPNYKALRRPTALCLACANAWELACEKRAEVTLLAYQKADVAWRQSRILANSMLSLEEEL